MNSKLSSESSNFTKTSQDYPNESSSPTNYYRNSYEHILDEFRWLNKLLNLYLIKLRNNNFYSSLNGFSELFIADEEIDALVSAGVWESESTNHHKNENNNFKKLKLELLKARHILTNKIQKTLNKNTFLPIVHLSKILQLDEFEYHILIICLAPQLETRYERLYAYLQNNQTMKYPCKSFIRELLTEISNDQFSTARYLRPTSSLYHYQILKTFSDQSINHDLLKIDDRIISFILEEAVVDNRIKNYLKIYSQIDWNNLIVAKSVQDQIANLFRSMKKTNNILANTIYFYGRKGTGKKMIARALCHDLNTDLIVVDAQALLKTEEKFQENVRLIVREAILLSSAIYFENFQMIDNEIKDNFFYLNLLIEEINESGWLIFIGSTNPPSERLIHLTNFYSFEIHAPDNAMQKKLWSHYLKTVPKSNKFLSEEELSVRYNLTGGQIVDAISIASGKAKAEKPSNYKITGLDILDACRIVSQPKLSNFARKINAVYRWSDIVLPENQMQQLKELINHVKLKYKIIDAWGFRKKQSGTLGLTALFVGPSGTGKTMAAEILADELDLDLYKIDLSTVVSKYIGETEKNLERIFTEAEYSNTILFFDEADALFGKRSEVKDAHDRYANIEISYLLQRMESYEGISILASNFRQNIDAAFIRRVRFIIDFPFPDEDARKEIWRKIFPEQTPLDSDIDYGFLAKNFKINGGTIRNIALNAAYLAASEDLIVLMNHLISAAKSELEKTGKMIDKSKFKNFDEANSL